jgi:putative two-component system response regulator
MTDSNKILIVEDELITAEIISTHLKDRGYTISGMVDSGEAAIKSVETDPPALVLMDIRLHGSLDGIEAAHRIRERLDVPIIYLTAYSDAEVLQRAAGTAPYGYLIKPFDDRELVSNIEIALQKHRSDCLLRESEERLQITNENLLVALHGIIQAMGAVVETRDPYTAGHQRRVARLAGEIGRLSGMTEQAIEGLVLASAIHDIGKIGVPSEILSKPLKLSAVEFEIVKTHSKAGYEIIRNIEFPWPIAEIVYQHHEKINGSGYPRGLAGNDMLLESKVLVVADVVEAISSHRPYRPALGIDVALEELAANRGILYDPNAVDVCSMLFKEKKYDLEQT